MSGEMIDGALLEHTLFGVRDKVAEAVQRIRGYADLAGKDGYWLAYSGGKDSVVILELCKMACVKFEAHHSLTTIDPPELVQFVRETPEVVIDRPKLSFFQLVVKNGFPLRHTRWCCAELKEGGGKGRLVITGVRWEESAKRSKRRMFDVCYKGKGTRLLHPIIDWSESDVWAFIRYRSLRYCRLYDEGRKRLGCLFCPMQPTQQRIADLERYPKYANAFRKAFQRRWENRMLHNPDAVSRHKDGYAMFDWWINDRKSHPAEGGLFV